MKVDGNISDLFFNTDVSRARRLDKRGHFENFDRHILIEEAQAMLDCLARLGLETPSASALADDFLARV